jgi:sec-independent protein translocase protein TatA
MGSLGPLEISLIILAILLLFGYKKLPDASRSLGRSLRIFKGEMKGMKDDAAGDGGLRTKDAATAIPVRGEIVAPGVPAPSAPATSASGDLTAQLDEEARVAEARAAELRARAEQTRAADGSR